MKQYDSYLIYGCHFPEKNIKFITEHSSLKYFNTKIINQYNCEILVCDIPQHDDEQITRYFLRILLEQSDDSIVKLENLEKINKKGFKDILELFEIEIMEPYLISIPIVREL